MRHILARKRGSWSTATAISQKHEQIANNGNEDKDRVSKSSRQTGGFEAHDH